MAAESHLGSNTKSRQRRLSQDSIRGCDLLPLRMLLPNDPLKLILDLSHLSTEIKATGGAVYFPFFFPPLEIL